MMNIDPLRERFPDEDACREFFENIFWNDGRYCPHCFCLKSYHLKGASVGPGVYECAQCKRQFIVTTHTPLHSTKWPLWKWILAMFLIVNSRKGISSVYIGKLIGISQKSAWKIGHAIRQMMDPGNEWVPALTGIIELGEKYVGGKPRYQKDVVHPRGKGASKQ
jgi:transposase-like protein